MQGTKTVDKTLFGCSNLKSGEIEVEFPENFGLEFEFDIRCTRDINSGVDDINSDAISNISIELPDNRFNIEGQPYDFFYQTEQRYARGYYLYFPIIANRTELKSSSPKINDTHRQRIGDIYEEDIRLQIYHDSFIHDYLSSGDKSFKLVLNWPYETNIFLSYVFRPKSLIMENIEIESITQPLIRTNISFYVICNTNYYIKSLNFIINYGETSKELSKLINSKRQPLFITQFGSKVLSSRKNSLLGRFALDPLHLCHGKPEHVRIEGLPLPGIGNPLTFSIQTAQISSYENHSIDIDVYSSKVILQTEAWKVNVNITSDLIKGMNSLLELHFTLDENAKNLTSSYICIESQNGFFDRLQKMTINESQLSIHSIDNGRLCLYLHYRIPISKSIVKLEPVIPSNYSSISFLISGYDSKMNKLFESDRLIQPVKPYEESDLRIDIQPQTNGTLKLVSNLNCNAFKSNFTAKIWPVDFFSFSQDSFVVQKDNVIGKIHIEGNTMILNNILCQNGISQLEIPNLRLASLNTINSIITFSIDDIEKSVYLTYEPTQPEIKASISGLNSRRKLFVSLFFSQLIQQQLYLRIELTQSSYPEVQNNSNLVEYGTQLYNSTLLKNIKSFRTPFMNHTLTSNSLNSTSQLVSNKPTNINSKQIAIPLSYLLYPTLNVGSRVESVSISEKGEIEIPKTLQNFWSALIIPDSGFLIPLDAQVKIVDKNENVLSTTNIFIPHYLPDYCVSLNSVTKECESCLDNYLLKKGSCEPNQWNLNDDRVSSPDNVSEVMISFFIFFGIFAFIFAYFGSKISLFNRVCVASVTRIIWIILFLCKVELKFTFGFISIVSIAGVQLLYVPLLLIFFLFILRGDKDYKAVITYFTYALFFTLTSVYVREKEKRALSIKFKLLVHFRSFILLINLIELGLIIATLVLFDATIGYWFWILITQAFLIWVIVRDEFSLVERKSRIGFNLMSDWMKINRSFNFDHD